MDLELATFWLTAAGTVATLLALIVATVLGVHEIRSLRREQDERELARRAEIERQRRAQAECVSAVLSVTRDPHTRLSGGRNLGPAHHAYVTVVNGSSLPIYDARPSVKDADGQVLTTRAGTFVAGGSDGHIHVPAQATSAEDGHPVELRFRDAAGVYWHRLPDGELHESTTGGDCWPNGEHPELERPRQ